jgi:hypothetical protein
MERVMPRVGGKLFVDTDARGIFPMMPIDGASAAAAAVPAVTGGAR